MSCIILQIGQCGNQVCDYFWNEIDDLNEPGYIFQHPEGYYRSVAVDTEPKVLKRLCGGASFRPENVIMERRGRGNNWAFGYYGQRNGNEGDLFERIMSSMHREIERCDNYCGTVLVHSLGGGTGSGVGSRVVALLRDEYPNNYITSYAVAPFSTGESPLQNYNSLLSLSILSTLSDGIVYFSNDDLLQRLRKRCSQSAGKDLQVVSLNDLNKHIARCMAGVMAPVETLTSKEGISIGIEPWEMLRSLCPMPTHKILHLNTLSAKKSSWENITSALVHSLNRRSLSGTAYASLANLVVARGDRERTFPSLIPQIESQIKSAYCTVKWNPYPVDFWTSHKFTGGLAPAKSLTVGANYSNIVPQLEGVLHSSRIKFEAKAYLHWYEKYGCRQEDFQEAFDNVQTVIDSYKDATK